MGGNSLSPLPFPPRLFSSSFVLDLLRPKEKNPPPEEEEDDFDLPSLDVDECAVLVEEARAGDRAGYVS